MLSKFPSPTTLFVPLSEDWRHSWSIRTCISTAAITFLFLYSPIHTYLVKHFVPAFCVFVTIAVKDVTLGASLVNAWSCIWGCFISCSISSIVLHIVESRISHLKYDESTAVILLFLFISSYIMQYMEIQPMGKKMGLSFLPVVLMGLNNPGVDHQEMVWRIYNSVLLGSVFAVIGTILPFPRLATTEVEERLNYFTITISSLMKNATYSWLIQPVRAVEHKKPMFPHMFSSRRVIFVSEKPGQTVFENVKNCHWKKVKMIFTVISAFKRSKNYRIGWIHRSHHRAKDLYTRIEIIKFLQEEVEVLVKRNVEARFGPNRTAYIRRFSRFVVLSRNFLTILSQLEKQVQDLETQSPHYPTYRCFFLSPNFRRRYTALVTAICTGYEQLHRVFIVTDYRYDEQLIVDAMLAMHAIVECKDLFNREYFRLRKSVYYNLHTSTVPLYGATSIAKTRNNLFSEVVEVVKPVGETNEEAQPLVSEVLFNMNTVIFLLEEAADMIVMFWNEGELNDAEDIVRYLKDNGSKIVDSGRENNPPGFVPNVPRSSRLSARSSMERFSAKSLQPFQRPPWKPRSKGVNRYLSLTKWLSFVKKSGIEIFNDLFPAQSHLFCFKIEKVTSSNPTSPPATVDNHSDNTISSFFSRQWHWWSQWRVAWQWTTPMADRSKSALTLALSMTIGGVFGIYADRPQAVMTAFTIAYLSGGSVSGANIVQCLNRAAGTVLACVYSVTCIYVVELSGMIKYPHLARTFIGFAIVLAQYPCTYIRSFPLYSYTGTCAGFTVGLILIDYFTFINTTVNISINRIVDTVIAVFIYLLIELGLFAQLSEVTLMSILQKIITGIDQRFSRIYSHIAPSSSCKKPLKANKTLNAIGTAKEDIRKLFDVDSMHSLLIRQRDLLPFYKSEPKITSAPALPDRLLQEALHWQEQAVMSLQIMMWVVLSCDEDSLHRQEHRIAEITTLITEIPDAITGSSLQKTQLKLVNPLVLERRRSLSTRPMGQQSAEDTAETLLLPLEKQYREVEVYISQALSFLSLSIQELQHRPQNIPLDPLIRVNGQIEPRSSQRGRDVTTGDLEMGLLHNHDNAKKNKESTNVSDSMMRRIHNGQTLLGGGLIVNTEDETIVPLDPVSHLRRIHQARNFHMIHEQQKQQRSKFHRTRHRSSSSQMQMQTSSLPRTGSTDTSDIRDPVKKFPLSSPSILPNNTASTLPGEVQPTLPNPNPSVVVDALLESSHKEPSSAESDPVAQMDIISPQKTGNHEEEEEIEDMELKPSFGEAMKIPRHREGLPMPQPATQQTTIQDTEAGNDQYLQETDTNASHTQTVTKAPPKADVRLPLDSLITKSEPTLVVRERRASSTGSANEHERHHSGSAPSTPRSRQNSMDDPAAMEYVFFAEVESHQVECLFSSYQQLLETIQERIVEHQVLSAHEDIVVLSEEKKADAPADHDASFWHAHALSTRSLSSRHPPPSFSDSRFTPVHHPIDLHHSPDQHLLHQHLHIHRSKSSISQPPSPPPLSPPQSSHIDHLLSQQLYHQLRYPRQQTHDKAPKMNQTVMRISSNKEIKVVNTLLNSTRDLLQALRSLSRVISRLQAHRDIRWTQDARKVE